MSWSTPTKVREIPPNPMLVALVVSLAAFMEVLDTTITNVSLSHIAGSLAASQDESTWVLTSYLVANGIILPLSGWLAGVLGRKNFFMMCIAGFTVASFACGIATSLPMLVVFRILQGFAGGGLQPIQQAIIIDAFPPEKRGTVFAITGLTMIVAPILGPTLGGYITDNYSWRWIFFMNVPIGIMAVLLVRALVSDPDHAKAKGFVSVDYIGLSTLAIGLGCLQIMLDKGQEDDWFSSHFIVTLGVIASVCLSFAFFWLLRQKDPVVDLRLLKDKYFGPACLMIFFVGFTLYGASTLLPLLVQSQFGYDATLAGLVLSPGGFVVIFLMPIAGKLVNKIQARYLISFGMVMTAIGMAATMFFTPQTNYGTFVGLRMLQVIGLPFLFVPTSTIAFTSIPKEKSSKASALFALMRNLGGSFGISVILAYIERHEQMHQNFLSQHLAPTDTIYQNTIASMSSTITGYGLPHAATTAAGRLYQQLITQSAILSYGDAFQFLAIVVAVLAVVALCIPANNTKKNLRPIPPPRIRRVHLNLTHRPILQTLLLTGLITLGACEVGPDYEKPEGDVPADWVSDQTLAADTKAEVDQEWWKNFDDPILTQLINQAAGNNFDLKIAEARILQSRAGVSSADAALLPTGDVKGTATREANQLALPGGSSNPFASLLQKPFNIFQTGFDASWELDLFGGNRRAEEAAEAQLQASEASRDDVRVSLMAEVARNYVVLRDEQMQLATAEDIVASDQKTVAINYQRFEAGEAPRLDVTQAEAQLENAQSQIPELQSRIKQTNYDIDVLIGAGPARLKK